MDFLEKNLTELIKVNPDLVEKIIEHQITDMSKYKLAYSKCDDINLYIDDIPVHDTVDPVGESLDIWQRCPEKGKDVVRVIYGMGLGYLFKRVVKEAEKKILVYEPDMDILRIALEIVDFGDILSRPQIKIVQDKFYLKTEIESISSRDDNASVFFLQYHKNMHSDALMDFVKDVETITNVIQTGFTELKNKSKNWARCISQNLKYVAANEELHSLTNSFENKPAVIVSAGPSLKASIEHIKKYRDNIVVVAVGMALKALLKENIRPDFCIIIESANACAFTLDGLDLKGINFIFPAEVNPSIYQFEFDRVFNYYTENLFTSDWVQSFSGVSCLDYINRGTVSIAAFWTAKILGCNPLILTGQDLAYVGGKCYAGDAFFNLICTVNQETGDFEFEIPETEGFKEAIKKEFSHIQSDEQVEAFRMSVINKRKQELAKVKGQNGEILPTSTGYALFVKHFEEIVPMLQGKTLINCSTGGAQLDGYENALMQDVLEKYAPQKIDVEQIISEALKNYQKPTSNSQKNSFLNEQIKKMTEFIKICKDAVSFLEKFEKQRKHSRIIRTSAKQLFDKSLGLYGASLKMYYSNNKFLISLLYSEFLDVEKSLKSYNNQKNDENLIKVVKEMKKFFENGYKNCEECILNFENCKENLNINVKNL